jgi:hypothetical protein
MDVVAAPPYASPVQDLTLTNDELRDAAQAARLAAAQAQRDAETHTNPRINATFVAAVERYKRLAAKFDATRHGLAS